MAITLATGIPGAGKTLNTIAMVDREQGESDRPIFYRGITDLKLPWQELSDEEIKKWYEYPEGSVFIIDECQQIWPNRKPNSAIPESVEKLDTHRHGGYDFYIITQKPTMVDFYARGFVGRHYHYERAFNRDGTRQLEFQKAVDNPNDYHTRQDAQTTRIKFPKKYYDAYKSAEIHTYKPRIPKKAFLFLAAVVFTIAAAVMAFNNIMGRTEDPEIGGGVDYQGSIDLIPSIGPAKEEVPYEQLFTPRIPGIPHSAPAYDGVTEVKTFPRPQCIFDEKRGRCKCFTQQATPLDIEPQICMQIVRGGWFNPYKEEGEAAPVGRQAAPRSAPRSPGLEGPRVVTLGGGSSAQYPGRTIQTDPRLSGRQVTYGLNTGQPPG